VSRVDKNKTQGFTLVELLVVMLVLVALSSITLDFTKDFAFQGRYEVTKDRYDKIKRAIIGRPDVLINGQPDISGFVADVGRLPNNLHELLEERFCSQRWKFVLGSKVYYETQAQCTTDGLGWSSPISGWNGPYLTVKNAPLHDNAFPDGWGNQDSTLNPYCTDPLILGETLCTDAGETWYEGAGGHNYGWSFTNTGTQISLQSLGKNQAAGGSGYDEDYPPTATLPSIRHDDWTVDISAATVSVLANFSGNCTAKDTVDHAHSVCNLYEGTWDNVTSTCRTRRMTLNNVCTEISATWDAVTSSCSVPATTTITHENVCNTVSGIYAVGPPSTCTINTITLQTQCPILGGTWDATPNPDECQNIPLSRNHCTSDIAEDAWSYNLQGTCMKIINHSTLPISSQTISENGRQHSLLFPTGTNVPMGEIIGIIFDDTTCTSGTNYNTDRKPSICINAPGHLNFTKINCENKSGIWIEDGSERYCDKVVGTDCTTALGGTELSKFTLNIFPHTTAPIINW